MGKRAIVSMSLKQKLNTKISTEAELVGANDASSIILCTKLFLEARVNKVEQKQLYQDNKSTILIQETVKIVRVKGQEI